MVGDRYSYLNSPITCLLIPLYLPIILQHYLWHIGLSLEAGTCAYSVSNKCLLGDFLEAIEGLGPTYMIKVNRNPILCWVREFCIRHFYAWPFEIEINWIYGSVNSSGKTWMPIVSWALKDKNAQIQLFAIEGEGRDDSILITRWFFNGKVVGFSLKIWALKTT
jgi:hypothetical protein